MYRGFVYPLCSANLTGWGVDGLAEGRLQELLVSVAPTRDASKVHGFAR